jgi:hypothetical protein
MAVLQFAISRFSSAILADLAIRGFAISFVTFARVVLLNSVFDSFLVIAHDDIRRDAIQSGLELDSFGRKLASVCFMGQRSNVGACQYAAQRQTKMLPCSNCSREVAPQMALLSQDLDTEPLTFCSAMCHEMWFYRHFVPISRAAVFEG